jgi:hypothetical protein
MNKEGSGMTGDRLTTAAYWLALVLAACYALAGIIGWIANAAEGGDLAFWLGLLLGGAVLILAGLFLAPRWSVTSVVLLGIGGLAGALALWWSVVAPILAIVLIGLAVAAARRNREQLAERQPSTR